jgi:hypothetical protein
VRPRGLVERGTRITLTVWRVPRPDPVEDDAPDPVVDAPDPVGDDRDDPSGGAGERPKGGPGEKGKPAEPPGKAKGNAKGKKP